MRTFWLSLALLAGMTGTASAVCRCVCANGQMRSACSGPLDPPAICNRICPLSTRPPGAPPAAVTGLPSAESSESTLGTGSPAFLGATGAPGL